MSSVKINEKKDVYINYRASNKTQEGIKMPATSLRANAISAYIGERAAEENLFERIEVEGKIDVYPVYRIPLDKLYFNIRNGRFAAELRAREKTVGRKLDPLNDEDKIQLRNLLLEQNSKETDALRQDLERHGQLDAGIITHDGAIINANRRMAVISLLYEETRSEKWNYLKVAVLKPGVGEKDLWRIEAGLQFGKDQRAEYGPINELLKLREGIACGLDERDISMSLRGRFSDDDVRKRLAVLDLIDDYLECINRPGDYEIITKKKLMEKFNSLSFNVISPLKKKEFSSEEIARITEVAFAMIEKTDLPHWDIRRLAHIAAESDAYSALKREMPELPLGANGEEIKDAFMAGAELVEAKKLKDKPAKLIRQALSALQSIDTSSDLLSKPNVQSLLDQLVETARRLRSL